MANEQHITKTPEKWEWLNTLMDRTLWSIRSFIEIISQDDDNVHLVATLTPLVDNARAGLEILDDVLAESFGNGKHLKVEMLLNVCGEPLQDIFESYRRRYFGKAFVDPAEEPDKPQAAGGEASPAQLNAYDPKYANVRISVANLWKQIKALDAVADDPVKVREWSEKFFDQIGKCEVC